ETFAKIAAGIEDMQAAEGPQLIVAITQLLCDFKRARPDVAEDGPPASGIETRGRERDPKFPLPPPIAARTGVQRRKRPFDATAALLQQRQLHPQWQRGDRQCYAQ